MISREAARDACFDPNLTRSEDADFLLQLLLKYSYGLLHKVLYIYKINLPLDYRDMQYGYQSRVEVYKKFLKEFPFTSGKVILSTKMKQLLFWFVHQAGMDEHLIQKRPRELKNEELKTYHENLLSLKSTF